MSITVKLGTFTASEPFTVTRHYETASWFMDVLCPPGQYDVIAVCDWRDGRPCVRHSLYVRARGKITGGYMASSGFGYTGKNQMDDRIGEEENIFRSLSVSYHRDPDVAPTTYQQHYRFPSHVFVGGVWTRESSRTRDTVPLSALKLPTGLVLDPMACFVEFIYEHQPAPRFDGTTYPREYLACVQVRPEAYATAAREGNRS